MLLIISGDKPIFEYNFNRPQKLQTYFIIHSCLDAIDNILDFKKDFYLGQLRTQQIPIFAYINATGLKLLLVFTGRRQFDKKSEIIIRDFLIEVNRHLACLLMNPMYSGGQVNKNKQRKIVHSEEIKSSVFEDRIINLGKQYLRPFFQKKKI